MHADQGDLPGAIQKRLEQSGLYRMGRINQPVGWIEYRVKLIADIKMNGVLDAGLLGYWCRHVWEKTRVKRGQQLVQNSMLAHGVSFCFPDVWPR